MWTGAGAGAAGGMYWLTGAMGAGAMGAGATRIGAGAGTSI